MRFSKSSAAALALSLPAALAQTSTTCNPLDTTCPNNPGLLATSFSSNFLEGKSAMSQWTAAAGTTLDFDSNGAAFSIDAAGQAPTIATNFYIFFGVITVKMQAAPGAGIVSSVVLLSDDLDEIDWEWLGGNTTTVETNFFGKGNTTLYDRATYQDVASPQTQSHTYTIDWNADRIEWIIDGTTVRTVTADNSLTLYGKNYPQTPMQLKLGNWCGGCSGEPQGTVEWSGGPTTFNDAPYVMYVESVDIQNSNPASAYQWMGNSGSWQSIKVIKNGTVSGGNGGGSSSNSSSSSSPTSTAHGNGNHTMKHGTATSMMHTVQSTSYVTALSSATAATATAASASSTPSSGSGSSGTSAAPGLVNAATSLVMLSGTTMVGLLAGFLLL